MDETLFWPEKITPHRRDIIQKFISRFDHLHEAEIIDTFTDKNGEETTSVIARVADINLFVEEAPKLWK